MIIQGANLFDLLTVTVAPGTMAIYNLYIRLQTIQ